jgi:EAL domain-containing protein (putative c-di-GMP-specific phosphodiesterase class I)
MKTSQLFWVAVLAGLALTGVLAAFYFLLTEQRFEGALIASVLLLGVAQLAAVTLRRPEDTVRQEDLLPLRRAQESAYHEAAGLRSRVEALEKKLEQSRGGRSRLLEEVEQARRDFRNPPEISPAAARTAPLSPPVSRAAAPLPSEQLDLYLEPIVAMSNNATAHYRAWLWLRTNGEINEAGGDIYDSAERSGLRPALDVFALTRVIPVLRRLANNGRSTSVFIPVGRPTLAATAYLNEMIRLLDDARDVAGRVVLEVEHAAIAGMGETGIQGLAQLARSGATLGLGSAASSGIEFAALKNLGFRAIAFSAGEPGNIPGWLNAARIAGSQGLDVLICDVEDQSQAEAARRWARFASGPHFAPPRLVKSDIKAEPLHARAA